MGAGHVLPIGATNPKTGAVQFDGRRIDGVPFRIPSGASVSSAPIGSVVTLQEDANGKQFIVLGAAAYSGTDEYGTCVIIGVGFLEAAMQTNHAINQTVGAYTSGDIAAMIIDVNAVAAVPTATGHVPTAGGTSYITPDGQLSSVADSNVAFPGAVWFGTAGIQLSGQLKTGYCYARLKLTTLGTV